MSSVAGTYERCRTRASRNGYGPNISHSLSHRGDLLAPPHLLFRLHQNFVYVCVVRLHVFSYPVFFISMEHNYDIAPAGSGLIREQHAAIGHRVDRIPQVAVLTADAVQIVAKMAILGKWLRVVGERAVFASERKIEPHRGG